MIDVIPFISVGIIKLGDDIGNYLPEDIEEYDQRTHWANFYFYQRNVVAFVEADKIVAIAIYGDCLLDGLNLFNLNINTFFEKFKIPGKHRLVDDRVWVNEDEQHSVYEVESLGLQIWVNNLELIVTVICSAKYKEE